MTEIKNSDYDINDIIKNYKIESYIFNNRVYENKLNNYNTYNDRFHIYKHRWNQVESAIAYYCTFDFFSFMFFSEYHLNKKLKDKIIVKNVNGDQLENLADMESNSIIIKGTSKSEHHKRIHVRS